MPCDHCAHSAPQPPYQCFHCCCTVCGQHDPEAPYLICAECRSATHAACARHALEDMRLFDDEALGEIRGLVAKLQQPRTPSLGSAASASASAGASGDAAHAGVELASLAAGGGGKAPARQLLALLPESFHCSVDCALQLCLYVNPNFVPALSAEVERRVLARWAAVLAPCVERLEARSGGSGGGFTEEEQWRLTAAYTQIRFEGWVEYGRRERQQHHHPLLAPPAALDVTPNTLRHVALVLSPEGQATRLYLLRPSHPIGSAVVLPRDTYWSGKSMIELGDSNAGLPETLEVLTQGLATVVASYTC